MDPSHKARKNPSDNANLGFQAVGPALRIMQLNVDGLSAAKRHIIQSLAEIHHIDVIPIWEEDYHLHATYNVDIFFTLTVHAVVEIYMYSRPVACCWSLTTPV